MGPKPTHLDELDLSLFSDEQVADAKRRMQEIQRTVLDIQDRRNAQWNEQHWQNRAWQRRRVRSAISTRLRKQ